MPKKVCRLYTHDEQVKAAKHIAFEIQHFRSYSELKSNADLRRACSAASQAVGYALLLHLRVLIDFFFSDAEQDDFHVDHFRSQPGFNAAFPPSLHVRTAKTDEVSRFLNKLLAHFTAIRWEEHRPAWDYYEEYAPVIADLTKRFEIALSGDVKEAYEAGYRSWSHHSPSVKISSNP